MSIFQPVYRHLKGKIRFYMACGPVDIPPQAVEYHICIIGAVLGTLFIIRIQAADAGRMKRIAKNIVFFCRPSQALAQAVDMMQEKSNAKVNTHCADLMKQIFFPRQS